MAAEIISGHLGMDTYRCPKGILQVAHRRDGEHYYEINRTSLHNAAGNLRRLDGSGFTPRLLNETDGVMLQEDLGDSQSVTGWSPDDWQEFRRALIRCLIEIRRCNLRHGDLNGNNIIIRKKRPWIIDWQEGHVIGDAPPQVSPLTDTYWLCTNIIKWVGDVVVSDPYRVTRRWQAVMGDMVSAHDCSLPLRGKTLLDAGCFQGDFSAFAVAEGMLVVGVDPGGFRHGEDSITIARRLWDGIDNLAFALGSIHVWQPFDYDIILFMDTFPYIVKDFGREAATDCLRRMVTEAGRVYFETQMAGDQSGIPWLRCDDDVKALVPKACWTRVAVIPENGIDRTLWRVEC